MLAAVTVVWAARGSLPRSQHSMIPAILQCSFITGMGCSFSKGGVGSGDHPSSDSSLGGGPLRAGCSCQPVPSHPTLTPTCTPLYTVTHYCSPVHSTLAHFTQLHPTIPRSSPASCKGSPVLLQPVAICEAFGPHSPLPLDSRVPLPSTPASVIIIRVVCPQSVEARR